LILREDYRGYPKTYCDTILKEAVPLDRNSSLPPERDSYMIKTKNEKDRHADGERISC